MWAVIKVYQDYDYVEGAECLKSFDTQEDAEAFIQNMKKEQNDGNEARLEYIDSYVSRLPEPVANTVQEWYDWCDKETPLNHRSVYRNKWRQQIRDYLRNYGGANELKKYEMFKDYVDPVVPHGRGWLNLFAVEIK